MYRVEAPMLLRRGLQRLQHRQQHWAWAQQPWETIFPKMPTVNSPIHSGTEGAEEFDSPKQYDSLQRHFGEGKSEIWQGSYSRTGTIQTMPHLRAQPGFSLGPKLLPARTMQCEISSFTPLPPPCPLPTLCLHCPAQLGREGTLWWRYWCPGGAHPLRLSTRYRCIHLHPEICLGISFNTPHCLTIPQRKAFFFLQNKINSGSRGLRLEVFSCERGEYKKKI